MLGPRDQMQCAAWQSVYIVVPQGNKVKLTCQFRGREMEFQNIGRDLFEVRSRLSHTWNPASVHHCALVIAEWVFCGLLGSCFLI